MSGSEYLFIIAAMGLVTYIPRWAPVFWLTRRPMPRWLIQWLELIPAAILSALLVPVLVTSGQPRQIDFGRLDLLVALPTFLFALKTRSLGGTVVFGMALYWLVDKLM
ncbi:MAG: AzlD domain-containing protein [Desulfobacterales bacterium]|nr:AzlD domain-containing protein [Desulfobacterales bacterium]